MNQKVQEHDSGLNALFFQSKYHRFFPNIQSSLGKCSGDKKEIENFGGVFSKNVFISLYFKKV